jgi:hypothetical protein
MALRSLDFGKMEDQGLSVVVGICAKEGNHHAAHTFVFGDPYDAEICIVSAAHTVHKIQEEGAKG